MASLNFPDNASWKPYNHTKENITPFELIPRILGYCKNVDEACEVLRKINPLNEAFSPELPLSPLHWLLADAQRSVTVEFRADGLHLHENPMGVLTNNPPFEFQLFNLSNYLNLTKNVPKSTFAPGLSLRQYSRGMGAIGLLGDLSSASRFVKATFTKLNSLSGPSEVESVTQFSTFYALWPNNADAFTSVATNMSTPSTPPVATPTRGLTTTPPMKTKCYVR